MKNIITIALIAALVGGLAGGVVGKLVGGNQSVPALGGVTNYDNLDLGSAGTVTFTRIGGKAYADVAIAMTATSSIPCIIGNPFASTASPQSPYGFGTSTLESFTAQITTNGIATAETVDVSTTTATGNYGSSTPAMIFAHSVPTGYDYFTLFKQATTTSVLNQLLPGMNSDGTSNYVIKPADVLTLRIATATPRTLDSYWTGVCSARFAK